MASYTDYKDFIKHKLDMRTLLEQLAEEAIELSKASLKLIRAKILIILKTKEDVSINVEGVKEND